MSDPYTSAIISGIHVYVTANYPCSYLEGHNARSQVVSPHTLVDTERYQSLIHLGFRRSGRFVYRPHCLGCHACVPIRLLTRDFQPNRSQKRAWKKLEALLHAEVVPLAFSEEHYQLYTRYQKARHRHGGMDQEDPEQYRQFIAESQINTFLVEFRDQSGRLYMVSVIDQLMDGLSAVYTFYEPEMQQYGLGKYNILWQAAYCQKLDMPYLYLGYWIKDCRKMCYKTQYAPLEAFQHGLWQNFDEKEICDNDVCTLPVL